MQVLSMPTRMKIVRGVSTWGTETELDVTVEPSEQTIPGE